MKCPTEIAIDDRREFELANCGLMPLIHQKNSDMAVFIGAQSLHKPAEYNNPDATANARLAARLPYLFATCRFAHYLKSMVRLKIGSFKERADLERWLSDWIKDYVLGDPINAGDELRAQKPLADASVEVRDIEGNPGAYAAKFKLRPHFQLESVNIDLSLVAKLDKQS
jgi:type VI secretion system protein ImpC